MLLSEVKIKNENPIKTQLIKVKCDKCFKIYSIAYHYYASGRLKYNKDLCRGCKVGIRNKTMMSDEIKRKISKTLTGRPGANKGLKWTDEQKENLKKVRPNRGKWEEKFGKEKAKKMKKNLSEKFSGKNNPRYGKIPPVGVGNGWQGWYKNWYFRSLTELSYMINVIEKNNWKWENAEKIKYKISYMLNNVKRNYFGDFIINNEIFIEIKPYNLRNDNIVLLKEKAALDWCKINKLNYKIVYDNEFKKLTEDEIKHLHDGGVIKFTKKYEEKYKK